MNFELAVQTFSRSISIPIPFLGVWTLMEDDQMPSYICEIGKRDITVCFFFPVKKQKLNVKVHMANDIQVQSNTGGHVFQSCVRRGRKNRKPVFWCLTYCIHVYITQAPGRKKFPGKRCQRVGTGTKEQERFCKGNSLTALINCHPHN